VITKQIFPKNKTIKNQGGNIMKKTIIIDGMSCEHCKARVEKALNAIDGVSGAVVNLEKKNAEFTITGDVTDEILSNAIDDAGYDVVEIK
jgi:Cu+-exporting ATPase